MNNKNNDLIKLVYSKELCEASKKASSRWLNDSRWKPKSFDQYIYFLDSLQKLKKDLYADKPHHPVMKEGKYFV